MNSPVTPEFERTAAELDEVRKIDSRQPLLNKAIGVALAVMVAAVTLTAVRSETRADALGEVGAQRDRDIAAIREEMKGVCRSVPQGDLAQGNREACSRAERGEMPPPRDGQDGRAPTAEEIRAAVEVYFLTHPLPAGREPTVAQVSTAVAEYLVTHPPDPGRAPTTDEIATAVVTYFEGNPVKDGAPGRAPTAAEIAAAVRSYCAPPDAPSPCRGEPGTPGPPCPDGYEQRDAVATAPDGGQYSRAKTCVDPASSQPPTTSPTTPPLLPIPPS